MVYIPVGVGVQVNVTPDLFLLVNSQYRVKVQTMPAAKSKKGVTPQPN
jgi:hypothetical protein